MDKKELNMELRSEVLEMALTIEHSIMNLIVTCLSVGLEKPKALGNTSSSLSFKNKIDLLYDLEMIDKKQHEALLLLMEFRNQFLHNYECSTFVKAAELLNGKGSVLLRFGDNNNDEFDIEFKYKQSYRSLHIHCMNIVLDSFKKRQQQIEDRRKVVTDVTDATTYFYNQDTKIFQEIIKMCASVEEDSNDLILFKLQLATFLISHHEAIGSSDEFKKKTEQLQGLMDEQRIKNFYKR